MGPVDNRSEGQLGQDCGSFLLTLHISRIGHNVVIGNFLRKSQDGPNMGYLLLWKKLKVLTVLQRHSTCRLTRVQDQTRECLLSVYRHRTPVLTR